MSFISCHSVVSLSVRLFFIVRIRRDKMILAVNDPSTVVITMMVMMMMILVFLMAQRRAILRVAGDVAGSVFNPATRQGT